MTKMVETIYVKETFLKEELLRTFHENMVSTLFSKAFTELEKEMEEIFKKDYIEMQDKLYYSKKVVGCWPNLFSDKSMESFRIDNGNDVNNYKKEIQKYFGKYNFSIPTHRELSDVIYKSSAPWPISWKCPYVFVDNCVVSSYNNKTQGKYTKYAHNESYGYVYPLYRLNDEDSKKLTLRETLLLWLKHKLKPIAMKNKIYDLLLQFTFTLEDVKLLDIKGGFSKLGICMDESFFIDYFKSKDNLRANILKYDEKMFHDANKGSWELFENVNIKDKKGLVAVKLSSKLCARNPETDIVDGIIGIDFGTKSTVVVYSKNKEKILPMRVGLGDWSKNNRVKHYENPTVMEFNNLEYFLRAYKSSSSRPLTKWKYLTISHTAYENLKNSKSDDFNAYLTELKQWAGDKKRKLKIRDKVHKNVYELHPFLELKENDINPIELYAYYLGLYINNQINGIYLDYILSFPVTYEQAVRQKILDSFSKGLQKSLPTLSKEKLQGLRVSSGVSEPAAYAAVAMQNYGFEEMEKSFYAIFDFGGGTTDFDYGIFRWSDDENRKEKRYDYVIEQFGAGGDRFLGGENILELLAFHVFKANKQALLKDKISFVLPPECDEFLGSEILLSDSREAKLNMVNMVGILRSFWEREDFKEELFKGQITVDLYNNNGELISQMPLKINEKELKVRLKGRIKKGVDAFFESLREVFANHANKIDLPSNEVNIFLAGNSSKSPLVKELFDARIKQEKEAIQKNNYEATFNLFAPLDNKSNFEKPNGKTGVAYGLIETRPGGRVLVQNRNIGKKDIKFKYYLGINKRRKFRVKLNREIPYNQWIEFIDAGEESFEIYYTSIPSATTNSLNIDDSSILRKRLKIKNIDEDKNVYIRFVSPSIFEYGVGLGKDIKSIMKVDLDN